MILQQILTKFGLAPSFTATSTKALSRLNVTRISLVEWKSSGNWCNFGLWKPSKFRGKYWKKWILQKNVTNSWCILSGFPFYLPVFGWNLDYFHLKWLHFSMNSGSFYLIFINTFAWNLDILQKLLWKFFNNFSLASWTLTTFAWNLGIFDFFHCITFPSARYF